MGTTNNTRRAAFTLSNELLASLSYCALRLGTSKSELLDTLLQEPLGMIQKVLFQVEPPLDSLSPEERAQLFSGYAGMVEQAVSEGAELAQELRKGGKGGQGGRHG